MDWFDVLQSIISGIFVGLVVFGLDQIRAKRERRLSDFRIAANWEVTEPKPSLRNFDLRGTNLSGYDLSRANLESADLQKTLLWGTSLNGANLRKTHFLGTNLVGVDLRGVIAYYADFSKAKMRKERTGEQPLTTNFSEAVLRGCKFQKAEMHEVLFNLANLMRTDFSNATVVSCDFTGADLTDSKWNKVKKVENCIWKDVKGITSENFQKDLFEEVKRQNAKM